MARLASPHGYLANIWLRLESFVRSGIKSELSDFHARDRRVCANQRLNGANLSLGGSHSCQTAIGARFLAHE